MPSRDELPTTVWLENRCPACKTKSLFVAKGNYITCGNLECKYPDFDDAAKHLIDQQIREAFEQNKIDRCEWYCRGISSVAMDLINGKSVELTLERATQRTQKWEDRRKELLAQLSTKPLEREQ